MYITAYSKKCYNVPMAPQDRLNQIPAGDIILWRPFSLMSTFGPCCCCLSFPVWIPSGGLWHWQRVVPPVSPSFISLSLPFMVFSCWVWWMSLPLPYSSNMNKGAECGWITRSEVKPSTKKKLFNTSCFIIGGVWCVWKCNICCKGAVQHFFFFCFLTESWLSYVAKGDSLNQEPKLA